MHLHWRTSYVKCRHYASGRHSLNNERKFLTFTRIRRATTTNREMSSSSFTFFFLGEFNKSKAFVSASSHQVAVLSFRTTESSTQKDKDGRAWLLILDFCRQQLLPDLHGDATTGWAFRRYEKYSDSQLAQLPAKPFPGNYLWLLDSCHWQPPGSCVLPTYIRPNNWQWQLLSHEKIWPHP